MSTLPEKVQLPVRIPATKKSVGLSSDRPLYNRWLRWWRVLRRCSIEFLGREGGARIELVPSFTMRNAAGKEFEADFGMLAKPSRFSHTSSPHGAKECV